MRTIECLFPALLAALALFTPLHTHAQPAPPPAQTGWQTEIGLGAIVNPELQGGDEYQVRPIPFFDVRYRDERGTLLFANVPQGLGGYVYRSSGDPRDRIAIGVGIAPGFTTRDGDEIAGLEELDIATEARVYLEFDRGSWGANAILAADLGTGHEGAYVDLSVQRRGRIGRRGFWTLGPTVRIADSDYNEAQYGVAASQAALSGLPAHDAGSGVEQISLGGVLRLPLSEKWSMSSVARIGRLVGDRGDSPVVEEETQAFLLVAVTRPL